MRVVATDVGFDNLGLRKPGDEFDMPDGAVGSWFKPIEEDSPAAEVQAESEPEVAPKRKYTKRT